MFRPRAWLTDPQWRALNAAMVVVKESLALRQQSRQRRHQRGTVEARER